MRKGKTKKELQTQKKKELAETLEYLRQVEVSESQGGGSKFVRDIRKEEKKKEKEERDRGKNYLESRIHQTFGYRSRLSVYSVNLSVNLDSASQWEYYCVPTGGTPITVFGKRYKTQEGIVHILKSPKENVYIRAVGVTYDPEIDIKNVHTMMEQAQNTIDSERGILLSDNMDTRAGFKKTKGGILLPN